MTAYCSFCRNQFSTTDQEEALRTKLAPVFSGRRFSLPLPEVCPDCRQQRRLAFRNEHHLYSRTCDFSGKNVISIYSPCSRFSVYDQAVWWSDAWDALSYGRDFDFNRSFFDQFGELMLAVPRISLFTKGCENCEYTNHSSYGRNCYLHFNFTKCEDCAYGGYLIDCRSCYDCLASFECELCSNLVHSRRCYNVHDALLCENCTDCRWLYDCSGCSNCFLCTNLRNKQFCLRNEQLTASGYRAQLHKLAQGSFREEEMLRLEFGRLIAERALLRAANNKQAEQSSGDFLTNVERCSACYHMSQSQDCCHCYDGFGQVDCLDCCECAMGVCRLYEAHACNGAQFSLFANICYESHFLLYCDSVHNSTHCFGCSNLRHKQYCILNKQYTKEGYEELVTRIAEHMTRTGEWGRFFPANLSPFPYNETIAQVYYPLAGADAAAAGFNRFVHSDAQNAAPAQAVPAARLPDCTADTSEQVLSAPITCAATGRPFRLIRPEIQFYQAHGLALPRLHPTVRIERRLQSRSPRRLLVCRCSRCGKDVLSTVPQAMQQKVCCDGCYLEAIYR